MSKGKIVFYDDDPDFTSSFEKLFGDSGFEIITFNELDELREFMKQDGMYRTKALIFDLARSKTEEGQTNDFEILDDIQEKFNQFRIPIFIHSAFAQNIENFRDCGTVWKIEKSSSSMETIVQTIENLDESGFLEAFTPGGLIEQNLMEELHRSFTEQFRDGEIEKIIALIKQSNPDTFKERAINVFKRTAVKALMSALQAPVFSEGEKVSPIEHYYRRISPIDFWTGDILKKKDAEEHLLIITPRCNVASSSHPELLVCEVIIGEFPASNSKIKDALTDNPSYSGYNRYLPPSPLFKGGKVVLSKYSMKDKKGLLESYERVISLSDELTNEVIGKFGAYFFRTGITPWNQQEVIQQVKS